MLKLDKNLSHISQRKDSEKSFCYWYDEQEQKLLKGYIFLRQKSQTTTNNSLHSWPMSPLPLFNNKKKWQTSKYNLYFYCCIFDPLVTCLSVSEIKCFLERWKYIFITLPLSFLNNGPEASPFAYWKDQVFPFKEQAQFDFHVLPQETDVLGSQSDITI